MQRAATTGAWSEVAVVGRNILRALAFVVVRLITEINICDPQKEVSFDSASISEPPILGHELNVLQ